MKNIKRIALLLTLVVAAFGIACDTATGGNDPNSPSGVTKRFVKAAQTRNTQEYKSVMSKKSLASMEKDAKEVEMTTDQLIAAALKEDMFGKSSDKEIETRSESISGERATVQFKDGNGKWLENDLVKEDGNWKVTVE